MCSVEPHGLIHVRGLDATTFRLPNAEVGTTISHKSEHPWLEETELCTNISRVLPIEARDIIPTNVQVTQLQVQHKVQILHKWFFYGAKTGRSKHY